MWWAILGKNLRDGCDEPPLANAVYRISEIGLESALSAMNGHRSRGNGLDVHETAHHHVARKFVLNQP
jgi:hypothetical protein